MLGLAYGDCLGGPVEFSTEKKARKVYGRKLNRWSLPRNGRVTDDTQMALAVGEAVGEALYVKDTSVHYVMDQLVNELITWYLSPDNTYDRAPGGTCMTACRKLTEGHHWLASTDPHSKGCGANMRVAPVGLVDSLSVEHRSGIAQLQAAMTHGHPTALIASDVTQQAVWLLNHGTAPRQLLVELMDYCHSRLGQYHEAWLGPLWRAGNHFSNPNGYVNAGWYEVHNALVKVNRALKKPHLMKLDPSLVTGEGWVAEECLATALYCFLQYPDDPMKALHRSLLTKGDTDSLAAMTGTFVGAYHGEGAFPKAWQERIEYQRRLLRVADQLS
jgi:ADP-ribosylglycohydrolase